MKKKCDNCPKEFVPNKGWARFCCDRCRDQFWTRQKTAAMAKVAGMYYSVDAVSAIATGFLPRADSGRRDALKVHPASLIC